MRASEKILPAPSRPRIGVFYSLGPHFPRTLKRLRTDYPDGEITVMVPPAYTISDEERDLADGVVVTELAHYSPRNLGACLRLIHQIRAQNYDLFVVMFDSTQLRLFSTLTGASCRACCLPEGRLVALRSNLLGVLISEGARRMWGYTVYAVIWLIVRLFPVRTRE